MLKGESKESALEGRVDINLKRLIVGTKNKICKNGWLNECLWWSSANGGNVKCYAVESKVLIFGNYRFYEQYHYLKKLTDQLNFEHYFVNYNP